MVSASVSPRQRCAFAAHTGCQHALAVFDISRADLQTNRNALHLVLGELPARRIVAVVQLDTESGSLQLVCHFLCLFQHATLCIATGTTTT